MRGLRRRSKRRRALRPNCGPWPLRRRGLRVDRLPSPIMSALLPSGIDRLTDDGEQRERHDNAHGERQSPRALAAASRSAA